jgi:2-methylcitrate dehydratase PrpD
LDYTKKIADFVTETSYEMIPPKALEVAKMAISDSVGVTLAGSKEASGRICAQLVRDEKSNGEATLIGQGFKSSALMAAFANGTSAHALDYDYSFALMGQPTAGLLAAIFPLAETLRRSGRDLLEAFVVGCEVTAKLARTTPALSGRGGWHSTGTLGSLGAAVACAKILRLNTTEVQMALGIASSMASGIVWNFGTMTKPLHAGLASRNGVLAAKLAQSGFSANPLILEGRKGFYDTFSRDLPYDLTPLDSLGTSLELLERGVKIKPYPCGGLAHSAIDAVLEMRAARAITPQMVEAIEAGVTRHAYNRLIYRIPDTGLQGKFSLPYVLARALTHGKLSLDSFTDEAVRDPLVLGLAEKVRVEIDAGLEETWETSSPSQVTIRLTDGRTFSRRVDHPKGSPEVPLTAQELREKFIECARRALKEGAAAQALEYLAHLESLSDLKPLCESLTGEAPSATGPSEVVPLR